MSWRITFSGSEKAKSESINSENRTVKENYLIKSIKKIELRDNDGQIIRLGKGADFVLKESPLGVRPIYGSGPVYISRKGNCGKYQTSCWLANADPISQRPDIFIQPSKEKNTDEFFAITGNILIFEFDEKDKTFIICTVEEGHKAIITYDDSKKNLRDRYSYKIEVIKNNEYQYILDEYINPIKWK